MTQPKLILFDVDGTLLHSGGAGEKALRLALKDRFGRDDDLEKVEIAGRTDAAIARQIFALHGIEPTPENLTEFFGNQIFVLGDTPHDIACGKAFGAKTVAIATGNYTREQLAECEPDFLVDDLSDVDGVIKALGL